MNWFEGCNNLETARNRYRELLMAHHPDRHPAERKEAESKIFIEVSEQFQRVLRMTPANEFVRDYHHTAGAQSRERVHHSEEFYEVLEWVMGQNVDVEVIGDWIHVTNYQQRGMVFKLTVKGFWYSVAHKAMIWSPDGKKPIKASGISTDNLRSRFGAEKKRDKRYM